MLVPIAIEELLAPMLSDCSVAALTVKAKLLEVIPLWVAVMLLEPIATPVARAKVLMLMVAGLEDDHVAVCVRF